MKAAAARNIAAVDDFFAAFCLVCPLQRVGQGIFAPCGVRTRGSYGFPLLCGWTYCADFDMGSCGRESNVNGTGIVVRLKCRPTPSLVKLCCVVCESDTLCWS